MAVLLWTDQGPSAPLAGNASGSAGWLPWHRRFRISKDPWLAKP